MPIYPPDEPPPRLSPKTLRAVRRHVEYDDGDFALTAIWRKSLDAPVPPAALEVLGVSLGRQLCAAVEKIGGGIESFYGTLPIDDPPERGPSFPLRTPAPPVRATAPTEPVGKPGISVYGQHRPAPPLRPPAHIRPVEAPSPVIMSCGAPAARERSDVWPVACAVASYLAFLALLVWFVLH